MNTDRLNLAFALQTYWHADNPDDLAHTYRVYSRCKDWQLSEDQQIAALLHDSCEGFENQNDRVRAIKTIFGSTIGNLVDGLTRRSGEKYFTQYIDNLTKQRHKDAVPVKIADILDNLYGRASPPNDSLKLRYERALSVLEPYFYYKKADDQAKERKASWIKELGTYPFEVPDIEQRTEESLLREIESFKSPY